MEDQPRLAIVTGAAVRLGRAIATGLARDGYAIGLHYYRSSLQAEETAEEIRSLGVPVFLLPANLEDPGQIQQMFLEIDKISIPLRVLVNSAGIMFHRSLTECSLEDWDHLMQLNLRAPWLCGIEAAKRMTDGSCIINITDTGVEKNWTGYGPYLVSKSGLDTLTKLMAKEFAPRIRVNAVAPGFILPPPGFEQERWDQLVQKSPAGRSGSEKDVVEAVQFLVQNTFVTGETLVVDGGYRLV